MVSVMILSVILFSNAYAKTETFETKKFNDWKVIIKKDDFENEIKPRIETNIFSPQGKKIGSFNIDYFIKSSNKFYSALVGMRIPKLHNSWPDCDYEFTKYSIDNKPSQYFPKSGHACPSLDFKASMASQFKKGNKLKFSASGVTGVIDLKGFTKAWNFSLLKLLGLKNSSKVPIKCSNAVNILKQAVILSNRLKIVSCSKQKSKSSTVLKGFYSTPLSVRNGNHIPYEIFYRKGHLDKVRFFNDPSDEVNASDLPVH